MSRVSYFKNVNPTIGLDATQNQMLNTLQGQIASKAEASALTSGLAQKADSSAVTYALSSKADASAVTSLSANLASEVIAREGAVSDLSVAVDDKLALKAVKATVDASVSALGQLITATSDSLTVSIDNLANTKLATSVYDARIVNEAVFFDSVKNSIVFNDAAGVELDYAALGLVPA
jgi:hypothetical protein